MAITLGKIHFSVISFFSKEGEDQKRLLPKSLRTNNFSGSRGDYEASEPLEVMLTILRDLTESRVLRERFDDSETAILRLGQIGRLADLILLEGDETLTSVQLIRDPIWQLMRELCGDLLKSEFWEERPEIVQVDRLLYQA